MRHGSSAPPVFEAIRTAPWWAYILFLQNLFHLALPPAIGQTWSLAIEEQYYFLWAPVVRVLRAPWMLATLLVAALVASPLFRLHSLRLDHADAHAHPPRRHRHGQPAGPRPLHAAARAAASGSGIGLVGMRHRLLRGRNHRRRHRISRLGAHHCASPVRCSPRSPRPARAIRSMHRCVAGRWPSTAASATAST